MPMNVRDNDRSNTQLVETFRQIVGAHHVIINRHSMESFCRGYRSGTGTALAVVRPGSLVEQWKILKACISADKIVIMQAENTSLTEGSTPSGTYDRDVVLISTTRMDKIYPLGHGEQIVSLPGATLFS